MIDKTERMNEFEGAKLTLERLNDYVRVTAHSGTNSSRFITIDFDKGKLTLTNSSIRYDIVIGEQVIQQGATIYENGIYITGTPFGMRAYVNYTSILLQGDQVMTGKKTLRISKVGDTATQAIVEVREY